MNFDKSHRVDKRAYVANFNFPFCNNIDKYERMCKVGEGTFGEVFKARDKANPEQIVAVKRISRDDINQYEGVSVTTLRELQVLQQVKHRNLIKLIEVCSGNFRPNSFVMDTFLVFEFCEYDLAKLLYNRTVKFSAEAIKDVLKQFFEGLYFLHGQKVLHRDLKPANVLVTKTGIVKLADFGLAKPIHAKPTKPLTPNMVTAWYRPPELLLGDTMYSFPVDMWSAGCIMAEMWTRRPILQGSTDQKQLLLINEWFGPIDTNAWPSVHKLKLFSDIQWPKITNRVSLRYRMGGLIDNHGINLLENLLKVDPEKRINVTEVLNHHYFWTGVEPGGLKSVLASIDDKTNSYNKTRKPGR